MKHKLFWKELVFLIALILFSSMFYFTIENEQIYWTFLVLSIVFFFVMRNHEKKHPDKKHKGIEGYFHHGSSHFLMAGLFFVVSHIMTFQLETTFTLVTLSIALILFSVGFMELIFGGFKWKN